MNKRNLFFSFAYIKKTTFEYFVLIIYFFCVCIHKMVDINIKTSNKAEVSVINIHENNNVNKILLKLICISGSKNIDDLTDKEVKGKYKVTNMSNLTKQQIKKYKIDRSKLIKVSKHSMYVNEDTAITTIMQSRLSDLKTIKFRSDLGFNQINLILKKEQTVLKSIKDTFAEEDMQTQHSVLGYMIDLYFHKYKLAIEVDELDILTEILIMKLKNKKH